MKQTKMIESDYCCPICNSQLVIEWGDGIHKGDKAFGGFLTCIAPRAKCSTPENVRGHGNGRSEATILSNAYKIIMAKYTGEKIDLSEEQPVEPEVEEAPVVIEVKRVRGRPPKNKAALPVVAIEKDEDAL